jgi:hypothetical protein
MQGWRPPGVVIGMHEAAGICVLFLRLISVRRRDDDGDNVAA